MCPSAFVLNKNKAKFLKLDKDVILNKNNCSPKTVLSYTLIPAFCVPLFP